MAIFSGLKTIILVSLFTLCFLSFTLFSSCSGEKKGTDEEEKIVLSDEPHTAPEKTAAGLTGGAKVYSEHCKVCHGDDGKKQLAGAKDLSASMLTFEQRIQQITYGKNTPKTHMPGYKGLLSEVQIKDVAVYLDSLKK